MVRLLMLCALVVTMSAGVVAQPDKYARDAKQPVDEGHVVLFANNPMWRGETQGTYGFVFNAILNFEHLHAGRILDVK